ncbi:MAG: hypothetical protein IT167_03040 [Bryobacterales bacterium]|nr:hypothetical protein [Bryobacterales bacterium]
MATATITITLEADQICYGGFALSFPNSDCSPVVRGMPGFASDTRLPVYLTTPPARRGAMGVLRSFTRGMMLV